MSNIQTSDVTYKLNDNPPFIEKIFAALQHLCAIFVPIMTPGYIVCQELGYDIETTTGIISMCLVISGIATFIQAKRFGFLGSGLLSIQGTSFGFVTILIITGKVGGLSLIFGSCLLGSLAAVIFAPFVRKLKYAFPPLVSGIVVILIGTTLMEVGIEACAGGPAARLNGTFGDVSNLAIAAIVVILIIFFQSCRNKYLRVCSIIFAIIIGFIISLCMGMVDFSPLSNIRFLQIPVPFKYGFSFNIATLLPIIIIYLVTCVEAVGDITATAMVSGEPIAGKNHMQRVSGGILTGGIISFIGSIFSSFPLSTFSQNNGIIQITGVASKHVGYYIAAFLFLAGIFPVFGTAFSLVPQPVLGGTMLIMFGTIAAAGIKVVSMDKLDRRALIIIAVSLGCGLGVAVPGIMDKLPELIRTSFSSGIATGGIVAISLNLLMPKT